MHDGEIPGDLAARDTVERHAGVTDNLSIDEAVQGYANMQENIVDITRFNKESEQKNRTVRYALNRFGALSPFDWATKYLNGVRYRSKSEVLAMLPVSSTGVNQTLSNSNFGGVAVTDSGYK